MFERFTPRARRVVVLAQDAAREMGHSRIKPEHLLLGLRDGEGMASIAMAQGGVDAAALRKVVATSEKSNPASKKVIKVPFSAEGKKVLEFSLRAALGLGHNYIGTEHIFLGLQSEFEQRGQDLDRLLGVSATDIQSRLMELLNNATGVSGLRSAAVQSLMASARRQARSEPVTSGHLLVAITEDPDSQASRALTALGITNDALRRAVAEVPVADTSDATPNMQNVVLTIGDSTTSITDPEVVAALRVLGTAQLRDVLRRAAGLGDPVQDAG